MPLGDSFIALNINLTNDCNFACEYCYFKAHNIEKKVKTIDEYALVNWVSLIFGRYNKNVYIDFLGGEPLLEAEKLIYISSKVRQIVESSNKIYIGEVTTNGYFLDSILATRLVDAGIRGVQVTFDGGPIGHDITRSNSDGKGSYQKILSNIRNSKNAINIMVRINIHNNTDMDDIENLLIDLKKSGVTNIYFAVIEGNDEHDKHDKHDKEMLAVTDNDSLELYAKAWNLQKKYDFEFIQKLPPILGTCIAKNKLGFTINYDGKMYLCPSTCGISTFFKNNLYDFNPIESDDLSCGNECYLCTFYPICLCGCDKIKYISSTGNNCRKNYFQKLLQIYFMSKYFS